MTATIVLASILLQGCAMQPLTLQYLWRHDEGLSYYEDATSAIEYPTETEPQASDPALFAAPRNIRSLDEVDSREVTLTECVRMALAKSTILRDNAVARGGQSQILVQPGGVTSVYEPALQATGFLFGNRGVEAALADFDALATTSITWGRDRVPQNAGTLGLASGQPQVLETAQYQTRLEKPLANGATLALQNDINYELNNRPAAVQAFPSSYTSIVQAEYRQPLWAGAGVEFNRIAGPLSQGLRGVSGLSQGILISRINNDIALAQFESRVKILVKDIEDQYWDLNLSLRLYQSEMAAFKDLLSYFNKLRGRSEGADYILQAESRIFEADARIRGSLADVLENEGRLRRLCHLPVNDGTFLYPVDLPSEAKVEPDWSASLQEAFSHRHELRQQKWEVKSLELQLRAARSLTRPRLDAVSQYRLNGLGDNLIGNHDFPLDTALGDVARGGNPGWNLGLQMVLPIGLRSARIRVRNHELRLRKNREVLTEMEREIAFELSGAMMGMQRWYELADSTVRRVNSAVKYIGAVEGRLQVTDLNADSGPSMFNLLLQAKIQQRDAEQAYMRSIIEYNKGLNALRFAKGTTLVDNEIYLAEGQWHAASAPFALQRAMHRTHGKDQHKLRTEPLEFVGAPAPGSWESLGTDSRPWVPEQPGLSGTNDGPGPPSPVPGVPDRDMLPRVNLVPPAAEPPAIDALPANESPVIVPPPPGSLELPKPVPIPDDDIVDSRPWRNVLNTSALAPVASETDDAGRVRM
ncbi:MAG: TolC family protein [Fuerstiella sp.]|nr:TolC family protein [Fuerstiella sp.]